MVTFESCDQVKIRGRPEIASVQIFGEQDFGGPVGWIGLNQSFDIDAPETVEPLTDNPAYIERVRVLDDDLNELISARRSDEGDGCRDEVTE